MLCKVTLLDIIEWKLHEWWQNVQIISFPEGIVFSAINKTKLQFCVMQILLETVGAGALRLLCLRNNSLDAFIICRFYFFEIQKNKRDSIISGLFETTIKASNHFTDRKFLGCYRNTYIPLNGWMHAYLFANLDCICRLPFHVFLLEKY